MRNMLILLAGFTAAGLAIWSWVGYRKPTGRMQIDLVPIDRSTLKPVPGDVQKIASNAASTPVAVVAPVVNPVPQHPTESVALTPTQIAKQANPYGGFVNPFKGGFGL